MIKPKFGVKYLSSRRVIKTLLDEQTVKSRFKVVDQKAREERLKGYLSQILKKYEIDPKIASRLTVAELQDLHNRTPSINLVKLRPAIANKIIESLKSNPFDVTLEAAVRKALKPPKEQM